MPILIDLAPILLALMAILVLVAGFILVELIGRALSAVLPFPGIGRATNWIANGFLSAIGAMWGWLADTGKALYNLIAAPVVAVSNWVNNISRAISNFSAWIHTILFVDIPQIYRTFDGLITNVENFLYDLSIRLYNQAVSIAVSLVNMTLQQLGRVETYLVNLITSYITYVIGVINSTTAYLVRYVDALVASVEDWAKGAIDDLSAALYNAVAQLEKYALDLANWALQSAIHAAEQFTIDMINLAIGDITKWVDTVSADGLSRAWPAIYDEINALAQRAAGIGDWIRARLGELPQELPYDLGAILGALGIAAEIPLQWIEECGADLCENLGGFGNEVNNLNSDLLTAAMIAFVAECIANPEPMARYTDEFAVEPLTQLAESSMALFR